ELFRLIEESELGKELIVQLLRHATSISQDSPPLIYKFAEAEISRLSRYLKDLGQGADLTYDGEDRDWLLGLTRVASKTIAATSLSTVDGWGNGLVDGGLWTSDLGVHYLEAQREAIRRGVEIRRLFIVDRPDLPSNPDFTSILKLHTEIGVRVRILRSNQVP